MFYSSQCMSFISIMVIPKYFTFGVWFLFYFLFLFLFIYLFIYIFCFFRAAPAAYGGSQAGGLSELQLPAYTTAITMPDPSHICNLHHSHGNAGSLTHWARPGIEPITSWFQLDLFLLHHSGNSVGVQFLKGIFYIPFWYFSVNVKKGNLILFVVLYSATMNNLSVLVVFVWGLQGLL